MRTSFHAGSFPHLNPGLIGRHSVCPLPFTRGRSRITAAAAMAPSSRGRLKWPGSWHGRSGRNTTRRKCCLTVGVLGEITQRNPKALRMRPLDPLLKDDTSATRLSGQSHP